MAESLLAHLYTHIKGSQEDIATWSLQYLISSSDELNRAFTKKVSEALCVKFDETLRYDAQVSEENIRPDMIGFDSKGKEAVFFEMKFYASLTANQPNKYLDMLIEKGGRGLLFICPETRKETLWSRLLELCAERDISKIADKDKCIKVDGINMSIITWSNIINHLADVASSDAMNFSSDIKQLKGYCDQLDSDAFIPFTEDDLKALTAKKEERHYEVVRKVTNLLLSDNSLKAEKYRASSRQDGFASFLFVKKYGLSLCYDRYFWRDDQTIETPFWLHVDNRSWKQTKKIADAIKNNQKYKNRMIDWYGDYYIGLDVLTNATEDEVCEHIKSQIIKILNDIDK